MAWQLPLLRSRDVGCVLTTTDLRPRPLRSNSLEGMIAQERVLYGLSHEPGRIELFARHVGKCRPHCTVYVTMKKTISTYIRGTPRTGNILLSQEVESDDG